MAEQQVVDDPGGRSPSRRAVLALGAGGAASAVAGCSVYGGSSGNPPPAAPPPAGGEVDGGEDGGPQVLGSTADVPVGGGVIFRDQGVVVTQPEAGEIRAFSNVCTHEGCPVASVSDGTINCTCHDSRFSISDGSVTGGPAPSPLPAVEVTVDGDTITLP